MKDKKTKTVLNDLIGIVSESKRKPKKLWNDQAKEFYNSFMQKCLDDNDSLMYSTHNKSKSVVSQRFIRTFKSKIYENMTANNSKSYLGYLKKLADEYNNTYHRFIGKKPIHTDYSALTEEIEFSHKSPKFKVDN